MGEETVQQSLAGVPAAGEKKTRAEKTRIHDRELKAMERIVRELNALSSEAGEEEPAARVVRYLAERFGFFVSRGDE